MEKKNSQPDIAILSMQRVVNFGSVLQAYSLRQLLQDISGRPVSFLEIDDVPVLPSLAQNREDCDYSVPASYPPGFFQRGKRWCIARLSGYNKKLIKRFMRSCLQLDNIAKDSYDFVVVGSDEVFNHAKGVRLQLHGQIPQAENSFTYAAACGTAKTEDIASQDYEAVRSAMSNYKAVSVRDRATEQYVKSLYTGPVERHLDPVLVGPLGQRKFKPVLLKNYLIVYAYGQRIRTAEEINAIKDYARRHGLRTVAMGGSQFWTDLYIPTDPIRLLDYFYHARCVVTDTFHGTVFSILCKKPFVVIPRASNLQKISGLLEELALEHRALQDISRMETILQQSENYEAVHKKLEAERHRTVAYLKEQLGVQDESHHIV